MAAMTVTPLTLWACTYAALNAVQGQVKEPRAQWLLVPQGPQQGAVSPRAHGDGIESLAT